MYRQSIRAMHIYETEKSLNFFYLPTPSIVNALSLTQTDWPCLLCLNTGYRKQWWDSLLFFSMKYSRDASSIRGLNAKIQTGERWVEIKRWTERGATRETAEEDERTGHKEKKNGGKRDDTEISLKNKHTNRCIKRKKWFEVEKHQRWECRAEDSAEEKIKDKHA